MTHEPMQCPRCGGEADSAGWPLTIGGQIAWGGCQVCWEEECSTTLPEWIEDKQGMGAVLPVVQMRALFGPDEFIK